MLVLPGCSRENRAWEGAEHSWLGQGWGGREQPPGPVSAAAPPPPQAAQTDPVRPGRPRSWRQQLHSRASGHTPGVRPSVSPSARLQPCRAPLPHREGPPRRRWNLKGAPGSPGHQAAVLRRGVQARETWGETSGREAWGGGGEASAPGSGPGGALHSLQLEAVLDKPPRGQQRGHRTGVRSCVCSGAEAKAPLSAGPWRPHCSKYLSSRYNTDPAPTVTAGALGLAGQSQRAAPLLLESLGVTRPPPPPTRQPTPAPAAQAPAGLQQSQQTQAWRRGPGSSAEAGAQAPAQNSLSLPSPHGFGGFCFRPQKRSYFCKWIEKGPWGPGAWVCLSESAPHESSNTLWP